MSNNTITRTFFSVVLYFTKVIPKFMVITYHFNHFSKSSCWEEQIHFQFGHYFSVLYQWGNKDWRPCTFWSQTTIFKKKKFKLKMNEIICDHHKIWNNFGESHFHWIFCKSYVIVQELGVCNTTNSI